MANIPVSIIAEIGQAHDGSLGTAHAYIDAVAAAGADAVKFQTHIASAESTRREPWRIKFSPQDETRYEYWRRMEFKEEQWISLREHAQGVGLQFISSPFSIEAVELLQRVGVDAWKIASGEVGNLPLLERVARDRRPTLLSSGMSPLSELDRAVETLLSGDADLTILQCTSAYPTPPEKLGLNNIATLRERYGVSIGLSDHSGTIFAGIAATALGATSIETHVTFSRRCFGPDVAASITIDELEQLVKGVRFIETALRNPVTKDGMATELQELRALFTKSLVASRPLPRGTVLTQEDLTTKKPGGGLPASQLHRIIGRSTTRALDADEQVNELDLEVDS